MILSFVKKQASTLFLLAGLLVINSGSRAAVTITRAAGGTGISADKAANAIAPAYTLLGDVVLTEASNGDFSAGTGLTLTLSCPAGWSFNPLATVSAVASPGNDIGFVSVTSVTSTLVTVQFTVSGVLNPDVLTLSGIQVRATDGGNVPGSANITRGGTAVISGCTAGANLGSLSQAAGSVSKLVITLPGQTFSDASTYATSGNSGSATTQTSGVSFTITKIRACDQFFNVVTGYAGVKTLTYSGPANGLTAPSYSTSVSFASGVSSTVLTTTLKKAESASISVSDGTISGPVSASFIVNPGVVSNFLVQSSSGGNIGSQVTGMPFSIMITARDANNNLCTTGPNVFTGNVDVSSNGTLTSGNGTTAAFTGGILSSHPVTISNQGNFTITAIKTGGSQTGSSNIFTVNYPPSSLSAISPSCISPGGPAFTLTATGTNFTPISIVQFNGSARNTNFINSSTLNADILGADIASPGLYSITVFTPGTGTTSPLTLNMNTGSSANVTICQGATYVLPDGVPESTAGIYFSHIQNAAGCDSSIITNLSVDPFPTRTQQVFICPGTSFNLPDGTSQSTPGTYISNIPNPPGCDSIITTILSNYQSPDLTATPVQIDCFGNTGSVVLNASNGLAPYTYGPEATSSLVAGTYNFSVMDANGCTGNASAVIDPEPSRLTLTATPVQIACFGMTGNVNLVASGGTPPYAYGLAPTSNLAAGNYNFQVTDNNGCSASDVAVINAAPPALSAVTTATNTACGSSTGTAGINVSGGTIPYSYSWNTIPAATTSMVSGLAIGNYTVTVTDNNGCTISKTATVGQSNPRTVTISGSTGICPGGTTTLCASAGFATYAWSTGETTSCITVGTANTFIVTVTDTSGCTGSKSAVTQNSPAPVCTITGGDLCPNGTVTLRTPTGYAGYLWSNNIRTSYNTVRSAGTYSVTIRNAAGCSSSCSYTVNSPVRISVAKTDGKCSNEFKGSATVTANAGIPLYTYSWSNGATTAAISGLGAGYYTVRVTDSSGCVALNTTNVLSNKTTNDYSIQGVSFNNNPITPGTYIWFSAVATINYTGNYPVTIRFINQNISSSGFNLTPANAQLIITNAVSQASTAFTGGEWVTTAPPNLAGNYFIGGCAYTTGSALAANFGPVKWKGIWTASSSCVTLIHWKWSAAAYSNFTTNNALINVNPVDDQTASPYGNNDFAGTPENYKSFCMAGALSTGATNYVGTYSAIVNRSPCSTPDACSIVSPRLSGYNLLHNDSNFYVNAYPNPFNSLTNIEFQRLDNSGHLKIDIYTIYGQKLRNIFDEDIEAGMPYTIEFDAGDLPAGIYFYRLISDDKEIGGRLYLLK